MREFKPIRENSDKLYAYLTPSCHYRFEHDILMKKKQNFVDFPVENLDLSKHTCFNNRYANLGCLPSSPRSIDVNSKSARDQVAWRAAIQFFSSISIPMMSGRLLYCINREAPVQRYSTTVKTCLANGSNNTILSQAFRGLRPLSVSRILLPHLYALLSL